MLQQFEYVPEWMLLVENECGIIQPCNHLQGQTKRKLVLELGNRQQYWRNLAACPDCDGFHDDLYSICHMCCTTSTPGGGIFTHANYSNVKETVPSSDGRVCNVVCKNPQYLKPLINCHTIVLVIVCSHWSMERAEQGHENTKLPIHRMVSEVVKLECRKCDRAAAKLCTLKISCLFVF